MRCPLRHTAMVEADQKSWHKVFKKAFHFSGFRSLENGCRHRFQRGQSQTGFTFILKYFHIYFKLFHIILKYFHIDFK
jgi:hypothetical protein